MDVFLALQILFDSVLLFGVLFLFHFSVNQQQKKKEEFDIVKNIKYRFGACWDSDLNVYLKTCIFLNIGKKSATEQK